MKILKTTNYDIFKKQIGNRPIRKAHVARLTRSMNEDYLVTPIIVNENMEIVDGQHRLEAQKELNLPTYYYIEDGYRLEQTRRLNIGSANWGTLDFLEGFCSMGLKDYLIYRDFYNKYKFDHQNGWTLLIGFSDSAGRRHYDTFKSGELKINQLKKAEYCADRITTLKKYYDGYKRRCFVSAMIRCFRNTEFDFPTFERKLRYLSTRLVDCTKVKEYIMLIENIYNYKSKTSNKIRLY